MGTLQKAVKLASLYTSTCKMKCSKWNNLSGSKNDHKWDFLRRAGVGRGVFKNRTTGEERVFAIKPSEKFTGYERRHYGLES